MRTGEECCTAQSHSLLADEGGNAYVHLQPKIEVVGDAHNLLLLKQVLAQPLHRHVVQEGHAQALLLLHLQRRRELAPPCAQGAIPFA